MQKITNIELPSTEVLTKLFWAFDELGFTHRYSLELGEFDVKIGEQWFMFYVDRRALDEERAHDEAFEDAQRVAEYYWRQ